MTLISNVEHEFFVQYLCTWYQQQTSAKIVHLLLFFHYRLASTTKQIQKTLKEIVDSLTWSVFFYVHLHLICFLSKRCRKIRAN